MKPLLKGILAIILCFFLQSLCLADITHQVKPKGTLVEIAPKYGVSVEELKKWDNLKDDQSKAGMMLISKTEKVKGKEGERVKEKGSMPKVHVVKPGETLESIAERYGLRVKDLKDWNNLTSSKVKPGTKIVLHPTKTETKKEGPQEVYHVVKKGETLASIAKIYGTSEETLRELNHLKQSRVYPGQKLLVKKAEPQKKERAKAISKKKSQKEVETLDELFRDLREREKVVLKQNPTRKTYLELASEYRRLFLLYPSSKVGPLALLRSAELYDELYQRYLKRGDLNLAVNYYEQFIRHYPGHIEEKRILERLGQIYAVELRDQVKAKKIEEELKKKYKLDLAKKKSKDNGPKPEVQAKSPAEIPFEDNRTSISKEPAIRAELNRLLKVEPVTGEDYTRVILDISGNFEYQTNILPETKDRPPRIYVDLTPVVLTDKVEREITLEHKHLQRIRVGQYDRTTVRIVLDLSSLTSYKLFKVNEPYQLIIDLVGKEKPIMQTAAKPQTKASKQPKVAKEPEKTEVQKAKEVAQEDPRYIPLARQLGLGVRRVVIDAGHGGEDPGAVGSNGLKEKDVVLRIALRLGEILRERLGVEVVYTRNSDVFIPLVKRPAIANSVKADLFVSIHLNASPDPKARGVETYYLNFTTDPEAMRVAALENSVADKGLADLQDLVKALITNTKLSESRALAEAVQRELVRTLDSRYNHVINRGVKYAPFLVLVGTRMPAILVEAEFISNSEVAELLKDEKFIESIAEGIARGIEVYAHSLKLSISNVSQNEVNLERSKP